ncbi:MAG: FHA domain-containing protein [Planctomycetaceae bacterium]
MSEPEKQSSGEDLWQEFASAFGGVAHPQKSEPVPGASAAGSPKPANLDAEEILNALEAMRPRLPAITASVPAPPKADSSLIAAPPVTVRLDSPSGFDSGVCLESRLLGPAKVGEKSLLLLRLRRPSFEGRCEIRVTSDLLEQPVETSIQLTTGLFSEAGPVRFVPRVAGVDQLELELQLFSQEGVPVESLRGKQTIRIRQADTTGLLNAGGDIIVVGKSIPGMNTDPFNSDDDQLEWAAIELHQDSRFPAYLLRIRPRQDHRMPDISGQNPACSSTSGAIYTRVAGSICCCAVVVAERASVGRGGSPETEWWIRPTTSDPKLFSRISRRHFTVDFQASHAWITDHSANGTFLNGRKLNPEQRTILADSDRIDLSGSIHLSVRLFSDSARVTQVVLHRSDELREKFVLVLSHPGSCCRFAAGDAGIWCVWKENDHVALNDGSGDWKNARTGETVHFTSGIDFAWHRLSGSFDQDRFFPGTP